MHAFAIDEEALQRAIAEDGWARLALLDPAACSALVSLYDEDRWFRRTVSMQRHNFGRGEYRYFDYPLPPLIESLRTALYAPLARIANTWRGPGTFPPSHADYRAMCRAAGQTQATPLLLRYGPGDFNCLHQDLYGALAFPFQATVMLNDPEHDFTGGEFVLVEQRPRAQSRAEAIRLARGEAVIFPVSQRVAWRAGAMRRTMVRHGVSSIRSGLRHTLGIIFHDAT